jgi:outer membrane immunogenic protein
MKKILIALSALAAISGSASAADLAARPYDKAPSMIAASYDWSGFYMGINGGGGWSNKCWDITESLGFPINPSFREGCHNATGGTAGGQIGYRVQSAAWVFGLEAQGNWADFRGSNTSLFFLAPNANRSRVQAFGLFTGQVGYSWNTFLLYVKGGGAVTGDRYDGINSITGVRFDTASETRFGGAVGIGGEYAFTPSWSFALEYDHLFMGTRNISLYSTVVPSPLTRIDRIRQDVDIVTARINYRFGGPVIAKY